MKRLAYQKTDYSLVSQKTGILSGFTGLPSMGGNLTEELAPHQVRKRNPPSLHVILYLLLCIPRSRGPYLEVLVNNMPENVVNQPQMQLIIKVLQPCNNIVLLVLSRITHLSPRNLTHSLDKIRPVKADILLFLLLFCYCCCFCV